MTVLLDTNVFIWALSDRGRISAVAVSVLLSNEPKLISPLTLYEVAQKAFVGELKLPATPSEFCRAGAESLRASWLAIEFRHTELSDSFPWHHRDPFDRLLALQGFGERIAIVSSDAIFDHYGIRRIW